MNVSAMTDQKLRPGIVDAHVPATLAAQQYVFSFEQAHGLSRDLLGGKGAELAEMTSLQLPVPPGFTVTAEACRRYFDSEASLPDGLWEQVLAALSDLESRMGRRLGDSSNPLLVSVRSGAAISMPGMMDTVLNLGMNENVAAGIADSTGDEAFAYDLYRRFVQMYSNVVLGVESHRFGEVFNGLKTERGVENNADLTANDFRELVWRFSKIVHEVRGQTVPEEPYEQLRQAIHAVFESWNTPRAIAYRNYRGISHDLGTAVNVQAMVYGNRGADSGTGVLFTRDPATGEKRLYGEYLLQAQGEDVVNGEVTPYDVEKLSLDLPDVYEQLTTVVNTLENHYRDVQDVEFTMEQGTLYLLQTRAAQRSARASVRIAVEMVEEGLISTQEAVLRIDPDQVNQLLLPQFDDRAKAAAISDGRLLTTGLGASPGAATGRLVLDSNQAVRLACDGITVILARPETNAEDVHGMLASAGVLTSRGGATSHAAVVARGVGKPCVTAASDIEVDLKNQVVRCGDVTVSDGAYVSIDGGTGEVFLGEIPTQSPDVSNDQHLNTVLAWADKMRDLRVWANADSAEDALVARKLGAEGIGLCRTEHMFFQPERLSVVREMIIAAHEAQRGSADHRQQFLNALANLEEIQTTDFEGLFRAMDGCPVVIRLLDPPLHEFLPRYEELLQRSIALRAGDGDVKDTEDIEHLMETVVEMREENPMMGLRGCRVGLVYPEIYDMQVRAIMRAAQKVSDQGVEVIPEIMVPLVSDEGEMVRIQDRLRGVIAETRGGTGPLPAHKIGAMIETPRAALTADRLSECAEFFSFGTNDLTQMTYAFSRDDAEAKFLIQYIEDDVLPQDPFTTIDRDGVGKLVEMAVSLARGARPGIEIGVCGEHGGDPSSIEFFHGVGLDYVSCSPYRVPIARLAAAQAKLRAVV